MSRQVDVASLSQRLADAEEREASLIQEHRREIAALKENAVREERRNDGLLQRINSLEATVASVQAEKTTADEKIQDLKDKNAKLKNDYTRLQLASERSEQQSAEQQRLVDTMRTLQEANEQFRNNLAAANGANQTLRSQMSRYQQDAAEERTRSETLSRRNGELQQEVATLRNSVALGGSATGSFAVPEAQTRTSRAGMLPALNLKLHAASATADSVTATAEVPSSARIGTAAGSPRGDLPPNIVDDGADGEGQGSCWVPPVSARARGSVHVAAMPSEYYEAHYTPRDAHSSRAQSVAYYPASPQPPHRTTMGSVMLNTSIHNSASLDHPTKEPLLARDAAGMSSAVVDGPGQGGHGQCRTCGAPVNAAGVHVRPLEQQPSTPVGSRTSDDQCPCAVQ